MLTTTCPKAERLAAFQCGLLQPEELSQIASHLESCDYCQSVIESSGPSGDALLMELRQAVSDDSFADESACRRAIARIEAMAAGDITKTRDDTNADNAPHAAPPLRTLGKYQLLEQIGQGGMGTVYKATHTLLKRTVAIKVLTSHRLADSQAVSRFRREIEAAGRVDHSHIVRASDADESNGQHFLVMEWLEGQNLSQLGRERGPLPVAQACEFIRQAALGLGSAHEQGIIHRDVKPSNLFVIQADQLGPQLKVLDLGLALLRDHAVVENELTGAGQVMGTYDYIAPEQSMESHTVDARADIYSLGCTFYFLLTGKPPFQGKTEAKKLLAHQLHEPPPITSFRSDVPPEVIAVLTKMMAKRPEQRFSSMRDVAHSLEKFARVPAQPVATIAPQPARRRPMLVVALLCGLLAIGAGVMGIIRFPTTEGDIVVETDDDDFSFRLSKGNVVLTDAGANRTYNLKIVREDKGKGEYELEVTDTASGNAFKTKSFNIKRGEKFALKAHLVPRQTAEAKVATPDKLPPIETPKPIKIGIDPPKPPETSNEFVPTSLDLVTKLGVQVRVEIASTGLFDGTSHYYLRGPYSTTAREFLKEPQPRDGGPAQVALEMGNGLFLVIPLRQIKSFDTQDKQQVLTLADGSQHRGKLLTEVVGKDGKKWPLADVKSATIVTSKPVEPAPTANARVLLTLPAPHAMDFALSEYHVQSAGYGFGHRIKIDADGEKLTPELTDFDKVAVAAVEGKWRIRLTAPAGSETAATWLINHPSSGVPRWSLIGNTRNGWRVVIVYSDINTTGFTLQKIRKGALQPLTPSTPHGAGVEQLAASRDGTRIFTLVGDNHLAFWELNVDKSTFNQRWRTKVAGVIRGIALDPSGNEAWLALAGSSNLSQVDTQTGDVSERRKGRHDGAIDLVFSPDGRRYLVTDFYGGIGLRDAHDGESLRKFPGHEGGNGVRPAPKACFSSNGERVLSTGDDQTVRLWNSITAEELKKMSFPAAKKRAIALAPNGKQALISQDNVIRIWNLDSGERIADLTEHKGNVTALAYGPNGDWAVSAAQDATLRIWDLATRTELAKLEGHSDDVTCVAIVAGGKVILSGSRDKTLRAWKWIE